MRSAANTAACAAFTVSSVAETFGSEARSRSMRSSRARSVLTVADSLTDLGFLAGAAVGQGVERLAPIRDDGAERQEAQQDRGELATVAGDGQGEGRGSVGRCGDEAELECRAVAVV